MTEESRSADPAVDSGAYVLNALGPEERAAFEVRLIESSRLRDEVTELTDTAVLLGLAVDPVAPSDGLRDSILSRLATTSQVARDVAPAPEPRRAPADRVASHARAQLRWFNRPVFGIAAAAAAIVFLIGGGVAVGVANQGAQQVQQADALAALNSAPDVQRAAASVSTGGRATLVWSLAQRRSAIIVNGLEPLPSGKSYELWYIDAKGVPTGAGLFDANGASTWRILDGRMSKGDTIGVTIEPAGGSKAPTTKPIVAIAST